MLRKVTVKNNGLQRDIGTIQSDVKWLKEGQRRTEGKVDKMIHIFEKGEGKIGQNYDISKKALDVSLKNEKWINSTGIRLTAIIAGIVTGVTVVINFVFGWLKK